MKCIAEIIRGLDGWSLRSSKCEDYDSAMDWIRVNGKEVSRHFEDQWWCSTDNGLTFIDFGSHQYFGRVTEIN